MIAHVFARTTIRSERGTIAVPKFARRLILFSALFLPLVAIAQDRGTIAGTIHDPTGSSVPDVEVKAVQAATGFSQSVRTSQDGNYSLPYLPVGSYTVLTDKPGFSKTQAANVRVDVNTTVRLDLTLTVGSVDH